MEVPLKANGPAPGPATAHTLASQANHSYHVLNRGNAGAPVFHKPDDYASFVKLIEAACLKALREGDTLIVWKLDRPGRDLRHLVNTVSRRRQRP